MSRKTERELSGLMARAAASQARFGEKIATLRRKLVREGCTHPEPRPFEWEHDDGYGRQSHCQGLVCVLCGAKNHYPSFGNDAHRWALADGVEASG